MAEQNLREISPGVTDERKRRSIIADLVIRLVKEKPLGLVGGIIVLILLFTAFFADLSWLGLPEEGLAPYGMNEIHLADRLSPPSLQYALGTDNLGRDVLSRVIHGARISMYVGLGASLLSVAIAAILGLLSGFFSGKVDMIIQRLVDAFMCFPPLFLYLTIMAVVGPGVIQVILVLGISRGIRDSRVVRSAVVAIKENVYVAAARAIGSPEIRTLMRHILPNVMAPIIILFSVCIGAMIQSEATLSFLGFGIPPPFPSWGGMLSGAGRQYMYAAPWICLWPGLALAIVVYGTNMLGDAVRDILDPRLRGGLGRYAGVKKKMPKAKNQAD